MKYRTLPDAEVLLSLSPNFHSRSGGCYGLESINCGKNTRLTSLSKISQWECEHYSRKQIMALGDCGAQTEVGKKLNVAEKQYFKIWNFNVPLINLIRPCTRTMELQKEQKPLFLGELKWGAHSTRLHTKSRSVWKSARSDYRPIVILFTIISMTR